MEELDRYFCQIGSSSGEMKVMVSKQNVGNDVLLRDGSE